MRLFQSPWFYSIGSHANNSRDLKMFRFDQHQLVSSPNNKKGAFRFRVPEPTVGFRLHANLTKLEESYLVSLGAASFTTAL